MIIASLIISVIALVVAIRQTVVIQQTKKRTDYFKQYSDQAKTYFEGLDHAHSIHLIQRNDDLNILNSKIKESEEKIRKVIDSQTEVINKIVEVINELKPKNNAD